MMTVKTTRKTKLDEQAARAQAVRWLAQREYCCAEMRDRLLQKGYPQELVSHTIDYLVRHDCLSEQRFAESFLRVRMARGETPQMAARHALAKGVDADVMHVALKAQLIDFDHWQACLHCLQRRDPQQLRHQDQSLRLRLARYLSNKGFDSTMIFRALDSRELMI